MNESNQENNEQANHKEKRPIAMAGETTVDHLNASALDTSNYQVAFPNPDEEINYNKPTNGLVHVNKNLNDEENKMENENSASSSQVERNTQGDLQISKSYARAYKKNKRYKLYWKIFTILSSLAIAGYLMVEAYALTCVIQEKSPESQSNSTVQYLMKGFLRLENLLFVNLYMNLIVYVLGLIIILYSVIILLIESDQPWKWFKGGPKKVARWGYVLFVILYTIGGIVQTGFVLSHLKDPTIQTGGSYYAYMIIRGIVFYANMACFRKIEKFKLVQTEVFKDVIEKKKGKLDKVDKVEKELDVNWQQLYEVDEDEDEQEQPPKQEEGGVQPQDVSLVVENSVQSGKKIELPDKTNESKPSQRDIEANN